MVDDELVTSGHVDHDLVHDDPNADAPAHDAPAADPADGAGVEGAGVDDAESSLVRPYVMTGGRTRATSSDLAVETMVTTAARTDPSQLGFERAKIAALCVDPLSIAEISSSLDMPLGVSRVLVTDMVSEGLLDSHQRTTNDDTELIEALIEGIRAL